MESIKVFHDRKVVFQVVDLLNDVYTCFDETIDNFEVYKVSQYLLLWPILVVEISIGPNHL